MTHITERERIELVHSLETVLGQQSAATLMEYLPATGWRDVATITDLDNLRLDLTTEFRTGIADLRTELAGLRTELKTDMAGLRTELKTDMAGLRTELKTDMAHLARTIVLTFVTTLIAFGGLIVAAAAIYKP